MSRNSEYFFRNAGRVAWMMKWKMYCKLFLWASFLSVALFEGVAYVFHIH